MSTCSRPRASECVHAFTRAGRATILGVVLLAGPALAQQPAAAAAPAPTTPQTDPYAYRSEGRRDPFIGLLGGGVETRPIAGARPEGLAGLSATEVTIKGIMQSRGTYVAMVQGADTKTYIAHANDKLADGVIKAITAQTLVITQQVNDPLLLVKQREIRKTLHEEAK